MSLDFTRLSEKGQIVVPSEVRKKMKLTEGTRFVILGFKDTIVLRKLELSEERLRLKRLLARSREKAEKVGFSEREIQKLLDSSRKATA
jgi:AbrB family looped-hinge helix DNA binding protein